MVRSIGTRPFNSYLLIAGDTSSIFEFTVIFYNELIQWWNPNQIVVVPGNHELWDPYVEMEDNVEIYRKFFAKLGIVFLQNDLMCVEDRKNVKYSVKQKYRKRAKKSYGIRLNVVRLLF